MLSLLDSPLTALPCLAFALSVIAHAAALQIFPRLGLLDFPERYGLTRASVPYPTGILLVLLFAIFFLVLQPLNLENIALLCGIAVLAVCCMIDDRTPLPPALRFTIQTLVALIIVAGGIRIDSVTNPLPALFGSASSLTLNAGWPLALSAVFTVLWLLFTINALNWFDGIPGQVSTLSTIAFFTIGCLALSARVNQPTLGLLALILSGLSLGMLCFDQPPPRMLMGDTGAMFLGLMIGVLTIYSGGKVATAFLVMGVPLVDLLLVIIRRISRGQKPWKGNSVDQHLHHRLLRKGWSPRQVIALTAGIGAMFGITALFLSTGGKMIAGTVLMILMMGLSWYSSPKG